MIVNFIPNGIVALVWHCLEYPNTLSILPGMLGVSKCTLHWMKTFSFNLCIHFQCSYKYLHEVDDLHFLASVLLVWSPALLSSLMPLMGVPCSTVLSFSVVFLLLTCNRKVCFGCLSTPAESFCRLTSAAAITRVNCSIFPWNSYDFLFHNHLNFLHLLQLIMTLRPRYRNVKWYYFFSDSLKSEKVPL